MDEVKHFFVVSQVFWHEVSCATILFVVTQGVLSHKLVEGFDASICGLWGPRKTMDRNTAFSRATPLKPSAQLLSLYVFYLKVLNSFPGAVPQCSQIEHQKIAQSPGADLFIKAD